MKERFQLKVASIIFNMKTSWHSFHGDNCFVDTNMTKKCIQNEFDVDDESNSEKKYAHYAGKELAYFKKYLVLLL